MPNRFTRLIPRLRVWVRRHRALVWIGVGSSLLLVGLALTTGEATKPSSPRPTFTYQTSWTLVELLRHIEAGEVVSITGIDGTIIAIPSTLPSGTAGSGGTVTTPPAPELVARTTSGQLILIERSVSVADAVSSLRSLGYDRLLSHEALGLAGKTADSVATPTWFSAVTSTVTSFLLIAVLVWVLFIFVRTSRMAGRAGASGGVATLSGPGSSGFNRAATSQVSFADVAGCDEAKLELSEAVEFLRDPSAFYAADAHSPRGVLLYGPPGTGKTMLAKAVANEANVPFLSTSGSAFVELYVGMGARRVREIFADARKLGKAVIFIDEFDALGKRRGGLNSHEEREQTLNELLTQLDGFATTGDSIVVIAATNQLEVLDPAALRPGRFTRKVHVPLPDPEGRRAILAVHARKKHFADGVDPLEVADETSGFSGAELADLLNEAAILSVRRKADAINHEDIHDAFLKVALGTSRYRHMSDRERAIIAVHEVGHAICGVVQDDGTKIKEISLYQHGQALGVTVATPDENSLPSEAQLRSMLVRLMGGRAAEQLLFHEVTGGASNDFEKATDLATKMVTAWGMGVDPRDDDLGSSRRGSLSLWVNREGLSLPDDVRSAQGYAIRSILDRAYSEAEASLLGEMDRLRKIAHELYTRERMRGSLFYELYATAAELPLPVDDFRPSTAGPRAWADIGLAAAEPKVRAKTRLAARVPPPVAALPLDGLTTTAARPGSASRKPAARLAHWLRRVSSLLEPDSTGPANG